MLCYLFLTIIIIIIQIESRYQNQYSKRSAISVDSLGGEYDYNSLMHYGPTDFAKDPVTLLTFHIANKVITIRGACKKQLQASSSKNVSIQQVVHVGSIIGVHARAYCLKENLETLKLDSLQRLVGL